MVVLFNGPAVNAIIAKNCVAHTTKIAELQQQKVTFQACSIALDKYGIAQDDLVPDFEIVPAGIVTLIELQNEGYAYIKP